MSNTLELNDELIDAMFVLVNHTALGGRYGKALVEFLHWCEDNMEAARLKHLEEIELKAVIDAPDGTVVLDTAKLDNLFLTIQIPEDKQ